MRKGKIAVKTTKSLLSRGIFVLLILVCCFSFGKTASAVEDSQGASGSLLNMSIEDLMNVEIASTASLTKTKARLVPAAVTTITKEQIQESAARSLFELLDIYVPNLQWMHNNWRPTTWACGAS